MLTGLLIFRISLSSRGMMLLG